MWSGRDERAADAEQRPARAGSVIAVAEKKINVRLRDAMTRAGYTIEDFAAAVDVSAATVERWVYMSRTPYHGHRLKAADLLGRTEGELWPYAPTVPRPPRLSAAGVCIWCNTRECRDPASCIDRHEGSYWGVCPTCEGAPWLVGCQDCLFGLVETVKFGHRFRAA
ncbi:helix-turn-helix domain-containing protein [Nocardia beijingensis]|uniref:helix-turn-helix domain-containing protein n=1 Tax=Nocardia beijingensis TaxID=95162 RepID=UPI0018938245|nr:helix-turn-helix transcriptional regulator [Nocardia beijingensis]